MLRQLSKLTLISLNIIIIPMLLVSAIILENLRYDYTPFEGSRTAYFLEVEKEIKKLPKQVTYETIT